MITCGDGVVQGAGPDEIEGTVDDEECDLGVRKNGAPGEACNVDCTIPRCGDEWLQPWRGEQCDDGDAFAKKQDVPDNVPMGIAGASYPVEDPATIAILSRSGCLERCILAKCSNTIDDLEAVEDAAADQGDYGCKTGNCVNDLVGAGNVYLKGRNSEDNPCLNDANPSDGSPSGSGSPGDGSSGGSYTAYSAPDGIEALTPTAAFAARVIGSSLTASLWGADCARPLGKFVNGGGGCPVGSYCKWFPGRDDPATPTITEGRCRELSADGGSCQMRGDCLSAYSGPNGAIEPNIPGGNNNHYCLFSSNGAFGTCCTDGNCGRGGGGGVAGGGGGGGGGAAGPIAICGAGGGAGGGLCGNGQLDPGEECDGEVGCNANCNFGGGGGGMCTENDCANGGDAFCRSQGKTCRTIAALPCIECVKGVGGVCDGTECANGGTASCALQGKDCSLTDQLPCIACIPKNSCGNGKIDPKSPTRADAGCQVTGTSQQLCLPSNIIPEHYGSYKPEYECYQGGHCANTAGSCAWEMTTELRECLRQSNPVSASRLSSQFTAQVQPSGGCASDTRRCCENGVVTEVNRDPTMNCAFPACNQDMSACITRGNECERAGCSGELCVPRFTALPGECSYVQNVACFDSATCEWTGSACAWRQTAELQQCLSDNADGACPTNDSCLTSSACSRSGGSAGKSCGAAGTSVCCSNTVSRTPLEDCDDGNQEEHDSCGNQCVPNCSVHSDCPEGACVNGQCEDICPIASSTAKANPWTASVSQFLLHGLLNSFTLLP